MRKFLLRKVLAYSGLAIVLLQSCKDDSKLSIPAPSPDQTFSETFDNYDEAYAKGWRSINKSTPTGAKWYDIAETPNVGSPNYLVTYFPDWNQAQFSLDSTQFPNAPYPKRYWNAAFQSQRASNGYVATSIASAQVRDFFNPSVRFDVSNWLVSPEVMIKNGDKVVFYTYSRGLSRLQLWVNKTTSLNVGTGPDNTGDFTIKLVDVNPTYAKFETDQANAFPTEWAKFEGVVRGLTEPVKGRFGFRHFLQDQAPLRLSAIEPTNYDTLYTQIHRTVVGIDEVQFKSAQ